MNSFYDMYKKYLSILILFTILSFSFGECVLNQSAFLGINGTYPSGNQKYVADTLGQTEILDAEEITTVSFYTVIIRQLSSRKNNANFLNNLCVLAYYIPTIFLIFQIVLWLCLNISNNSHKYILRFIHSKDGKKA